jgi:uncharacterized radical SAM protein YgiQ
MFLPTCREEAKQQGIQRFDVILITGDTYFDSPFVGVAVIGKILQKNGYKVGIIAQPDLSDGKDITRLGEPKLFWGVTAGSFDSMVANYTALKKRIKNDDMTPGGLNNRRPDRAVIKYCNSIRRYYKNTRPIVVGGIEASLRRIVHYDFWSDKLRKSILFNAKADYLVYGMGEKTIVELAQHLRDEKEVFNLRGLCYISPELRMDYMKLPGFDEIVDDNDKYLDMFRIFYDNTHPLNGRGLYQKHDDRYLIQNPPQYYLSGKELDLVYEMDFERDVHPYYNAMGKVKALDTTRFSLISHRGCFGECNFCAISIHQGREVRSRSLQSLERESRQMVKHRLFKGIVNDLGGPTANMYANQCKKMKKSGPCKKKRCLYPQVCPEMNINHTSQINILDRLRSLTGIRKIFISSGIRYDLVLADSRSGMKYLEAVVEHHTSGQLKIAPEHTGKTILQLMGKPDNHNLINFVKRFYDLSDKKNKKQFLTYYLIAAHPGCTDKDMFEMQKFFKGKLHCKPRQIQIFTPTPSTFSTLIYFLGKGPGSSKKIFVEKNIRGREYQKKIMFK